ncbi:hypothetical protein [Rhizobium mayense]|uniref:hypothetical protein n=1 Tax=Rhizobium mayense TaxID=1312184 RepID=UPI003D80AE9A
MRFPVGHRSAVSSMTVPEIDNSAAERAIHPMALGRNSLFAGSDKVGNARPLSGH